MKEIAIKTFTQIVEIIVWEWKWQLSISQLKYIWYLIIIACASIYSQNTEVINQYLSQYLSSDLYTAVSIILWVVVKELLSTNTKRWQ